MPKLTQSDIDMAARGLLNNLSVVHCSSSDRHSQRSSTSRSRSSTGSSRRRPHESDERQPSPKSHPHKKSKIVDLTDKDSSSHKRHKGSRHSSKQKKPRHDFDSSSEDRPSPPKRHSRNEVPKPEVHPYFAGFSYDAEHKVYHFRPDKDDNNRATKNCDLAKFILGNCRGLPAWDSVLRIPFWWTEEMLKIVKEADRYGGAPVLGRDQGPVSEEDAKAIATALEEGVFKLSSRSFDLSKVGNFDPALHKSKSSSPKAAHTTQFYTLNPIASVNVGKQADTLEDPFFMTRKIAYSLDHLDVQACRGDPNLLSYNSTFHHLGALHYLAKQRKILGRTVLFLVKHHKNDYNTYVTQSEWERRLKDAEMEENSFPIEEYQTSFVKSDLRYCELKKAPANAKGSRYITVKLDDGSQYKHDVSTEHEGVRFFQPRAVIVYDPEDKNFAKNYAGLDLIHAREAIGPTEKTNKYAHCPYCGAAMQNHKTLTAHIASAHYRLVFLCRRCKGGPYFSVSALTSHIGEKSCDKAGKAGKLPPIEKPGSAPFKGADCKLSEFKQDLNSPSVVIGLPTDGYGDIISIGKGYFPEDA